MKTDVHENSRKAYREGRLDLLPERQRAILELFRRRKAPSTDREVMRLLGFVDPNKVRPSITFLVDAGILFEVGTTRDDETGKTVRCCSLARPKDSAQTELFPLEEVSR